MFEKIRHRLSSVNDLENAPILAREIEVMLDEAEKKVIFAAASNVELAAAIMNEWPPTIQAE